MNKKFRIVIFVYLTIILLGALYPFLFLKRNQLQVSLDIVRTLSTLTASLAALFYFDPFGVKKKNIEKQSENVIKILEQFVGQGISIEYRDEKGLSLIWFPITREFVFNPYSSSNYYLKDIKDNIISFSVESLRTSQAELIRLKNHFWTPEEISEKIEFLELRNATNDEKRATVIMKLAWANNLNADDHFMNVLNGKCYTLDNLIDNYKGLIIACERWLENNSFPIK